MKIIIEKLKIYWLPILSALVILINIFIDLPTYKLPIRVWLIILLLLIQIGILSLKLYSKGSEQTNVIPEGFEVETLYLWDTKTEILPSISSSDAPSESLKTIKGPHVERWYIKFRNKKKKGIKIVDTLPIHAIIFVFNTDCHIQNTLSHERPFWRGTKPPYIEEKPVILRASGEPEQLCLLIRKQDESKYFIFSKNCYDHGTRSLDPFQEKHELIYDTCYISIQLTAGNLDIEPIWIKFINRGEKVPPKFDLLINNPCLNN